MSTTLKNYYENIPDPRTEFINQIMNKTGKGKQTVYRWISGKVIPSKLEQEAINTISKKKISFPVKQNKK